MSKVLVVDDSSASIAEVVHLLEKFGCTCITAQNGAEGLQRFNEHNDIDLIVTDINMPKMGGIEMCQELKKDGKIPPIIVVSSDSFEELKEVGKRHGVVAWVVKPFKHEDFVAGVKYILKIKA